MFSTGQIIFALLFAVSFFAIIVWSYKKDKKWLSKNYKGIKWVALFFIGFIIILFCIKYLLKD
jgi:sterol desaturase/sphingolipid hydroxylase (fatty acid hydroxylase superfamily)